MMKSKPFFTRTAVAVRGKSAPVVRVAVEKFLLSVVAVGGCLLFLPEKVKLFTSWIRRRGKCLSQAGKLNIYLFRGRPRPFSWLRPVISCSGDIHCLVRACAFSMPFISRSHVRFPPLSALVLF